MSYDPDKIIINIPPVPIRATEIEFNGKIMPFIPDNCREIKVSVSADNGVPELILNYSGYPSSEEKHKGEAPLIFELPFPPSKNGLEKRGYRPAYSPAMCAFRIKARARIRQQLHKMQPRPELIRTPVAVEMVLYRPDHELRDLDNMAKAVLDSFTRARVWTDDSLVHDLRLVWARRLVSGGKTLVRITVLA